MRLFPDDRMQSRELVKYIVGQRSIRKIGVLREDARYARLGTQIFESELQRAGQISVKEVSFQPGGTDFSSQLRDFREAKIDGLVIWSRPADGARILKQLRAAGVRIPVLGPSYLCSSQLIELAGTAAEGLVTTSASNPSQASKRWQDFERVYDARFGEFPDAYASYAYDGISLLIAAIEEYGPERERVGEALRQHRLEKYEGVSGHLLFDEDLSNIAPITMARVEGGKFVYWIPSDGR